MKSTVSHVEAVRNGSGGAPVGSLDVVFSRAEMEGKRGGGKGPADSPVGDAGARAPVEGGARGEGGSTSMVTLRAPRASPAPPATRERRGDSAEAGAGGSKPDRGALGDCGSFARSSGASLRTRDAGAQSSAAPVSLRSPRAARPGECAIVAPRRPDRSVAGWFPCAGQGQGRAFETSDRATASFSCGSRVAQ